MLGRLDALFGGKAGEERPVDIVQPSAGLRYRKIPRFFGGRRWVRAKLEAVEIPLKRTKKSKNARKKFL